MLTAPPSVRNVELVEVDVLEKTITYNWEAPVPPINGKLQFYSINFCHKDSNHCEKKDYHIVQPDEFCKLWSLKEILCKTVPLPEVDYDGLVQVK